MKKRLNSILNIITTIMIVLLFISIVSNFQTTFLGKKYNSFFGYALFEIKTASMSGTMEINDWILVKITDDIELNDIVTFEENGSFVTHRVIEKYKDTYITKGDSNSANDTPVNKSMIVGKVVKVLPKVGIIKKTILNEKVLILLIITIILGNSLFVKKESNNEFSSKIKEKITKKKKEKAREIKKEEKTLTKKETNQEDISKKYPQLEKMNKSKDLSKTVILSKVVVDKSKSNTKAIAEIHKQMQKEEREEKIINKQKSANVVEIK